LLDSRFLLVGMTTGARRLTPPHRCRLVAAALPARDPAAVVPFNRGSLHAAALSWTNGDTAWTDTNCGVGVITPTIPIIAIVAIFVVPPSLHIDLGHLDALGLDRSDERGGRQPPRLKRSSS
jgi:hypothetical protein